jgi:hypothetical protein
MGLEAAFWLQVTAANTWTPVQIPFGCAMVAAFVSATSTHWRVGQDRSREGSGRRLEESQRYPANFNRENEAYRFADYPGCSEQQLDNLWERLGC